MYKLGLEKAEEPEIKLTTLVGSYRKPREFQKNIYFCFIDYAKALTVWITINCGKFLKEIGIPDHLTCLLRNQYASQEATLEPDMEQQTNSKLGKEYDKAVYCHPAYLTYMQSTSCEMLGWMNNKLESRLQGEILTTSEMQMISLQWQKMKRN